MPDSRVSAAPDVEDSTATVTVRERFLSIGVSPEAFEQHLAAERVIVAGKRVTDPDTPAPKPVDIGIGLAAT